MPDKGTTWYIIVRPANDTFLGWIALAKREPFVTDGDSIAEPGPLWFEFGGTAQAALGKLKDGLPK